MFGYVVPDISIIKDEEYVLFHAFYCGICKVIGKEFGQIERLSTNYDITFFALLASDQIQQSVTFGEERCVGNPFQRRAIVLENPLLLRIARLNMIFCYYKAEDNLTDGDKGARTFRRLLKKSHQSAASHEPVLEQLVRDGYADLRAYEQQNGSSIDRAADCFARLLERCAGVIMAESASDLSSRLVYNIGKFVYLADALDDVDEDFKKKRYNPFLSAFCGESGIVGSAFEGRQRFIRQNRDSLTFIFATTVNRAIECFNGLRFNQSQGLLENIVHFGLRKKVNELLESAKKLKRPSMSLRKARNGARMKPANAAGGADGENPD